MSAAAAEPTSPQNPPSAAAPEQQQQQEQQQDAFEGMKIASHAPLEACTTRTKCPSCGRPRKYYCYDCEKVLVEPVPRVVLPVKADILHYHKEQRSKSTSVHGALLAPDFVRVLEYPRDVDAMEPYDARETVVLFPSDSAVEVSELPADKLAAIRRVVLLDSQWSNAPRMLENPVVAGLQHVKIRAARTAFWRYQRKGQDHLSTVEALYWFMREFSEARSGGKYDGSCDNLLWYFSFNYALIQKYYNKRRDRSFVHIPGYIHYNKQGEGDSSSGDSKKESDQDHEEEEQHEPPTKKARLQDPVEGDCAKETGTEKPPEGTL